MPRSFLFQLENNQSDVAQIKSRKVLLGLVQVVKEWLELTGAERNEEHKRAHIKDVFASKSRRIRD